MSTTKRTELFKLDPFRLFLFVFGAAIVNPIALFALKLNIFAHVKVFSD